MAHSFFENRIPQNGFTYDEYSKQLEEKVKTIGENSVTANGEPDFTKINTQRSARIDKTYKPSKDITDVILQINKPQLWMVISETWCGDSAQNVPYLAKMASLNPQIDFRVLLRDENPEIMDLYLTNGTRSIPLLVAFDEEGNELFKWGPRPNEAAELVKNAKAAGDTKPVFLEKLHLWYGKNRGAAIEKEMQELLAEVLA